MKSSFTGFPPCVHAHVHTHTHTLTHTYTCFILSFVQNEHNSKTSTFKTWKGSEYIRAVIIHNSVSEQREEYSYLGYSI
jgi:hypothetical protein